MDKVKVNDFVGAYARALNLSTDTTNILIDLMETIIAKYEAKVPYISSSADPSSVYLIKPVDGKYSVEDFFLNRLMRNIWSVNEITLKQVKEGFASIHTKGCFDPSLHEVSFNSAKLETQVDQYKSLFGNNFDRMKEAARRKVIMHEFEHGLQTRFKPHVLDLNTRESYKKNPMR